MERFLKVPHRTFLRLSHLARRERCPAVVLVYLSLLYHTDSRGQCFPGYERLREISGIRGRATLTRALKLLEQEGFLLVSRRHGNHGPNRYILQSSIIELKSSAIEPLKFNDGTPKVQLLNSQSSIIELELEPINYNQLTIPKELYRRERERERGKEISFRKEREKPFGPPDDPALDEEYYRFP